jgi:hypothetical protein
MKSAYNRILLVCIVCWLVSLPVFSQVQTLELNRGFITVTEIMERSCSMCHDWALTHEGLTDPVRYTPNKPEQSALYTTVAVAHSAVGLAIPIVIISSGIAINRRFPSRSLGAD